MGAFEGLATSHVGLASGRSTILPVIFRIELDSSQMTFKTHTTRPRRIAGDLTDITLHLQVATHALPTLPVAKTSSLHWRTNL